MSAAFSFKQDFLEQPANVPTKYVANFGLSEDIVRQISASKSEPTWMLEKRLAALRTFFSLSMPSWGPSLAGLDIAKIRYFVQPDTQEAARWEDVPTEIRETFDLLGIPEAERAGLGGVGAQFDSEVIYHNLQKSLQERGVIFLNMDEALRRHEDLVREYFMTRCVPTHDHIFAALHAAVWSGGTFIFVPRDVRVEVPLQAYFRMNAAWGGQFEHTLIIVEDGARLEYIEGCSAPKFDSAALHAGCVEIFVGKGAHVTYASMENWSKNTYNLNTKRAIVDDNGEISWISGNMGSGVTMLYPMSVLRGSRSKSTFLGVAIAGAGQVQDTGHKVALVGPRASAFARAKSISAQGGVSTYRGLVQIGGKASDAVVHTVCDAVMIDSASISQTIPLVQSSGVAASVTHEATCGRLQDTALFYLSSRGVSVQDATRLLITGFVDDIARALPLEYAVELLKLVEIEIARWK